MNTRPLSRTLMQPLHTVTACALILAATTVCATPPAPPPETAAAPRTSVPWTTFHFDNQRGGVSPVDLNSPPFRRLWTFDLGNHTWKYCQGASVWSACALIADINGRTRVFAGSYDHNVYCIDAESGEEVWRFTTGCLVKAAPALAVIDGRPMLFVASSDRAFYGLDAETGKKVWTLETYSWTYTVGESLAGSPLVENVDGKPVIFATMWNGDRRPLRTTQIGELFALEPRNGNILWKRRLSSAKLSPPTVAQVDGRTVVFVGSEDGTLYVSDARTGDLLWKYTTGHRIDAAPVFTRIAGQPIVIIVNAFGMMRALSAVSGSQIWQYKCGHEILSTPAIVNSAGKLMVVAGASDRCVHAIDAKTGERMWTFQTGKYVVASPAVARIRGRATVFINSLDNNLYVLDAETGCEIMRFAGGDMLWPYETRGISIWSSPSLGVTADGTGILLYPAHDGKLYAFTATAADKPRDGDAALTGWTPGKQVRRHSTRRATGVTAWLPPAVAGALMLTGVIVILLPARNRQTGYARRTTEETT